MRDGWIFARGFECHGELANRFWGVRLSVEFLGVDWSLELEREIAELGEMDLIGFKDARGLLVFED